MKECVDLKDIWAEKYYKEYLKKEYLKNQPDKFLQQLYDNTRIELYTLNAELLYLKETMYEAERYNVEKKIAAREIILRALKNYYNY